jgi:hypothetical protein
MEPDLLTLKMEVLYTACYRNSKPNYQFLKILNYFSSENLVFSSSEDLIIIWIDSTYSITNAIIQKP